MKCIVFITNMTSKEQKIWLGVLSQLLPNEHVLLPGELSDEQALNVDIAIVANPNVAVLERFPNLIWIQSLWAGVESLVDSFKQLNEHKQVQTKLVRLIDPHLADTMAEAVLTWTLYLHRNIPEYIAQRAGELGQAAMQKLLQNNFQVNSWSRSPKMFEGVTHYSGEDGLLSLLQNTDILVCLLPLTPQTYRLLNKQTLSHLPTGAKLINFARGGIINHDDLQALLDSKKIGHAVLDVFEQEPLKANSPLWEHANISILPHISATTNLQSASQVVAENILNYRENAVIPESVDLKQGY